MKVEDLRVETVNPAFTLGQAGAGCVADGAFSQPDRASPCRRHCGRSILAQLRLLQGWRAEPAQRLSVHTLIQPYAQAAAALANQDLPTAQILANRLSLPEARPLVVET